MEQVDCEVLSDVTDWAIMTEILPWPLLGLDSGGSLRHRLWANVRRVDATRSCGSHSLRTEADGLRDLGAILGRETGLLGHVRPCRLL
jgi:hypothetical protein